MGYYLFTVLIIHFLSLKIALNEILLRSVFVSPFATYLDISHLNFFSAIAGGCAAAAASEGTSPFCCFSCAVKSRMRMFCIHVVELSLRSVF